MSMTPEEQEQQELLQSFVEEGRELIDDAEPLIIELESQATTGDSGEIDSETINTSFRLFHSVKGGAGFLDLKLVSRVTHEAETLLDIFRKGEGKLTASHVDLINRASDFLRKLLDQIATDWNEEGHDEEADKVAEELRGAIAAIRDGGENVSPVEEAVIVESEVEAEVESEVEAEVESEVEAEVESEVEAEAPASVPETVEEEESTPAPAVNDQSIPDLVPLTPEILSQFATESEELLAIAEDSLMRFERDTEDEAALQEAFRALHSFKGNCGFVDFRDMMTLSNGAESILDLYRNKKVEYNPQTVSMLLEIIDFLGNSLKSVATTGDGRIPAASGLLHLLEDTVGVPIAKMDASEFTASTPDETTMESSEAQVPTEEGETVVEKPTTSDSAEKPAAEVAPVKSKSNGAPAAVKAPKQQARQPMQQRQSVRVDVEKVDHLLDLVGELVIAESMVAQNPDLQDVDIPLDRFERAAVQLNKITRDLQDISTSIRMIPLAGTFRRLHRLVRDVAQKSNKVVELEIEGEETEVDKTVIEKITDPLVHILRNSIDHGIEAPEERVKVGKERAGKVEVKAFYVGGEVWITIKDDGYGLNRDKLVQKAVERELVTLEEAELMPDEDVWQFIFQPGFSTAEKVTSVS
ncbi:MAG TPA: hypothetical protein ENH10_02540, partial [Bacteroidetes bacterium]|nr:hypothetical protein [Bacteroidota bacterium]HEX04018.1 hypothetical protein [Bacteroidota bacterium]